METFKNIDWHSTLEDAVDNVFVTDERMQGESLMYKVINDCVDDPLEDIESEYAEVDVDLIKQFCGDINMDDIDMKGEKIKKNNSVQEGKSYVPGIRKLPFNFPRRSCLSKHEQAMCLRVLLKLSSKEGTLTDVQRSEMEAYMALQKQINEEQMEFLNFAKSKWDNDFIYAIKCNKFVINKWKTKVQKLQQLPRFYVECKNIPLSVQTINSDASTKKIRVEFVCCLKQGLLPEITLPKLDQSCKLFMNPETLLRRYRPCIVFDKVTEHFRLPVSEDEYCEKFALESEVDIVISSSGLKCLLNNLDSNHVNTWAIPVVIKSHNKRNVVYIDKKLPPLIATVPEKNAWVYKYILRYYFIGVKKKSEDAEPEKCGKSMASLDSDDSECNYSSINHLKDYEEDLYSSDTDELESENKVYSESMAYKVFTIGPADFLDQHEQVTYPVKKYRMLVRTKTDGVEVSSDGKKIPLILAPKMEHQLGFGAEAATLEEGIHQWASLMFTPDASLARIRIEADTSEVIQIDRHTTMTLSNEMKRLYNIKVEDSLSILHNIIEVLSFLTPGRYIMKHTPKNGSFTYVYKEAENEGKNVYDLHTTYRHAKFQTASSTPWPLIDKMTTTPAIRCFNKMPAMFNAYPSSTRRVPSGNRRPRGRPRKQPIQAPLRRSLRGKRTMSNLIDAHWFPLASQGNIYSMTKLCSSNSPNKLLVASLKRKIYSCEYHQMPEFLRPMVKELLFTYIPSGAEIISIDAYDKSDTGDSFVIGITIMKTSTDTMERYLNIYTEGAVDGEGDEGSSIEAIAQNCLMVELSYTPYHLYHTVLPRENSIHEVVWLISGSDYRIHMIREDKLSHVYSESSVEKYFPELHDIQAIALWINIYYYDNYKRRVTAVGCECGLVKVALVDVMDLQVSRSWLLRYDKPVPSVIVFPHQNTISRPAFIDFNSKKSIAQDEVPKINVVISNTSNAVVFENILEHGMKRDVILSGSESSDCILCCCIADINMDGQNEILLGTYGQEVLIFALMNDTWELATRKLFDAPVHSISYMDITNDGMKELVVLTQRGVHILQHNVTDVRAKWEERYKTLLDMIAQEKL